MGEYMGEETKVQLALDFMNLHRALKVAGEAVTTGPVWLEVGTPLIKAEGMKAVTQLKKGFPDHIIVADMKTMDAGGPEVEMASKAGADVVCVLGAADDGTISEAVEAAVNYNSKIMVDLLGVREKVTRAKELEALGCHYVALHVGIDQQMKGESPGEIVKELSKNISIPLAVAGGITSETAAEHVRNGASIIIVGGAITKAENVGKATSDVFAAVRELKTVPSSGFKRYGPSEIRKALERVTPPNISDAMHRKGSMEPLEVVMPPGHKVIGKAVTVRTLDGDWAKSVEAIDLAEPGDVLVIDARPGKQAIWGELASNTCKQKGISGVIIDGAARDLPAIRKLGFPVLARHFIPGAGDPKGHGEIGVEITCAGQKVRNGDWIVADEGGAVVIPQEKAVEIANRALDVKEKESRIRQEIQDGSTLSKVLDLLRWEKVG